MLQDGVGAQSSVGPGPPAAGQLIEVGRAMDLEDRFDWSTAEPFEGGLRWRREIHVEGATFLKPRFDQLRLKAGDELRVRTPTGRVVEVLRGSGPLEGRGFWGLSVYGDRLELELRFASPYEDAPFVLEELVVGNERVLDLVDGRSVCGSVDFEDAACYESDPGKWANIEATAGVQLVQEGVALWCTGVNLSPDNLVLTNAHCIPDVAPCEDAEFVFGFRRPGCGDGSSPVGWTSYRCGATLVSSPAVACDVTPLSLDFSLNTVVGDPASIHGWASVATGPLTSGEAIYIPQHPAGRPLEIAHGDGPNVVVDGATIRYYESLDTESGSSGSPIFREDTDDMVGLHHCGGCAGVEGNRGAAMATILPLIEPFLSATIFSDGFESGDTGAWSPPDP